MAERGMEPKTGQIVHMRKVSKKIMFVDIVSEGRAGISLVDTVSEGKEGIPLVDTVSEGRERISLVFKFWEVPELKDRCSKGPDKLHAGDVIACSGVWVDGVFSVNDYSILKSWSTVSPGVAFKPEPPPVTNNKTDLNKDTVCKYFVNTGRCDTVQCRFTHHEHSIKEERRKFVDERMERKLLVHENTFERDQIESSSKRAEVFTHWIVQTYGEEYLRRGGILDVAGGRGDLGFELTVKRGYSCTIVDPRPAKLKRWQHKLLKKTEAADLPTHLQDFFDAEFFSRSGLSAADIQLVTGLHPDEATESIVDTALRFKIPFAVIPCCVFSSLFPRKLESGSAVTTYEDFCLYLCEKSGTIQSTNLPFLGRNQVIYTLP